MSFRQSQMKKHCWAPNSNWKMFLEKNYILVLDKLDDSYDWSAIGTKWRKIEYFFRRHYSAQEGRFRNRRISTVRLADRHIEADAFNFTPNKTETSRYCHHVRLSRDQSRGVKRKRILAGIWQMLLSPPRCLASLSCHQLLRPRRSVCQVNMTAKYSMYWE